MKEKNDETQDIDAQIRGLSGPEFKYIRRYCGYTQSQVGRNYPGRTFSAVRHWENMKMVRSSAALCLKNMVNDELWDNCRRTWAKYKGDKKDLLKTTFGKVTEPKPDGIVVPILNNKTKYRRRD